MIKNRIEILQKLKNYILENGEELQIVKANAERMNGWFTQTFIEKALESICQKYLNEDMLATFALSIHEFDSANAKTVGLTMAGNIPLVGFHDFLCIFLSGHKQRIKFSTKDDVLLPHLIQKMYSWKEDIREYISASEMLKGCDAYIATGSNNSARYFEYYFAKYPHIIRKNRTSVAILNGHESVQSLNLLADDVYQYFGLGCRNVTKLFVPKDYDFIPLLNAFKKYDELKHHNKYRNNLDYNLALYMINNQFYMSNESIILAENKSIFSAIAVLHYEYYNKVEEVNDHLVNNENVQAIIGDAYLAFGQAQTPSLSDFADGINTIDFLNSL